MTNEEAINRIKYMVNRTDCCNDTCWGKCEKCIEACGCAYEALEKQIPVKPYITDAYPHRAYCPRCYKTLCRNVESQPINNETKFCPFCGQALEDWSEEDDE